MSFITLDMETAYGDGLGFKTQTNEEYLRDPRFEVIGVSVKVDDGETKWFSGSHDEIREFLRQYDWANSALLAHNTMFDGSILAWHFGIVPAFYYDTLGMARAIHGVDAGGSLKALAERYGIGEKGDEVVRAYGKYRKDFTPTELADYGAYCCNDVELTYQLFQLLNQVRPVGDANVMESHKYLYKNNRRPTVFPDVEHDLIDMTLRMYIEPSLMINDALLVTRLDEIREQKQLLLSGLMNVMGCETEEAVRKKLCSNPQFAKVLDEFGVTPPMKTSPKTGKPAFAFAKTDEGFLELQEHPEVLIQQLCAVRLGTKSTMEEKRIERFISIGARNKGFMPIPLKYYGAHTGRWAGLDSINFQNLPSRDKQKKALKNSVIPPPGYVVINCDSSQIEARVLAWLAIQNDLVEQFRRGEDVYSIFASMIFGRKITRVDKLERFVGKTCILGLGYGTGADKLQHTLLTNPPGAELELQRCKEIVWLYRQTYSQIPTLWQMTENAMKDLMAWAEDKQPYWLAGLKGVVEVTPEGFRLPNSLFLRYPGLRVERSKSGFTEYYYDSRKGKQKLWGGTLVENIVQALARIIVGEQMLAINKRYKVVLTVHDAAVIVVPEAEREAAVEFVTQIMSTPPRWARTLPVACETAWGYSYGECLTDEDWEKRRAA